MAKSMPIGISRSYWLVILHLPAQSSVWITYVSLSERIENDCRNALMLAEVTLGITDMIKANTWVGQVAMALNVLAGFCTLRLFIAVFQNKFARQS